MRRSTAPEKRAPRRGSRRSFSKTTLPFGISLVAHRRRYPTTQPPWISVLIASPSAFGMLGGARTDRGQTPRAPWVRSGCRGGQPHEGRGRGAQRRSDPRWAGRRAAWRGRARGPGGVSSPGRGPCVRVLCGCCITRATRNVGRAALSAQHSWVFSRHIARNLSVAHQLDAIGRNASAPTSWFNAPHTAPALAEPPCCTAWCPARPRCPAIRTRCSGFALSHGPRSASRDRGHCRPRAWASVGVEVKRPKVGDGV